MFFSPRQLLHSQPSPRPILHPPRHQTATATPTFGKVGNYHGKLQDFWRQLRQPWPQFKSTIAMHNNYHWTENYYIINSATVLEVKHYIALHFQKLLSSDWCNVAACSKHWASDQAYTALNYIAKNYFTNHYWCKNYSTSDVNKPERACDAMSVEWYTNYKDFTQKKETESITSASTSAIGRNNRISND